MPARAKRFLFLIFLSAILPGLLSAQIQATGTVVRADSNTVIVLFPSLEAINTNQLLYITSGGSVAARLKVVRTYAPRVEARILQGSVWLGAPVELSMALSYENVISPWDVDVLVSYYKQRVQDLTANELDYEIQKVCAALGVSFKEDLRTPAGMRALLAKLYEATLKLSREERGAWHRYLLLVYRWAILEQPVDGLLDAFLQNDATAATRDDGLYFKASLAFGRGKFQDAAVSLREIVEKNLDSDHLFKSVLLLARVNEKLGKTDIAVKYLAGLAASPGKEPYWDEATLYYFQVLQGRGEIQKSLDLLKQVKLYATSLPALARATFWEYQTVLNRLGDRERAANLKFDFEEKFADSPLLPEIRYLETEVVAARNVSVNPTLAREANLKVWQDFIQKYPDTPASFRAFKTLLTNQLVQGELGDVAGLFENFRVAFPQTSESFNQTVPVVKLLLERMRFSPGGRENLSFPWIKTPYFYALLEDTRTNYGPSVQAPFQDLLSPFNQSIAFIRYFLEPVIKEHARYPEKVVVSGSGLAYELIRRYGRDAVGSLKEVRRISRLDTFPSSARSQVAYRTFEDYQNTEPLFAEKNAFEILNLKSDPTHVEEVFAWFSKRIRLEENPLANVLLLERITSSYGRLDLRLHELHRKVLGFQKTPEAVKILRAGRAEKIPDHALLFDKDNQFDLFDLRKDFRAVGVSNDYLLLDVTGREARIESRLLSIDSRFYRVMQIRVKLDENDVLDRGELLWQNWDDLDWDPAKKIPFSFLGDGEVLAEVPLDHPLWKATIKRLRLNFYSERFPTRRALVKLRDITVF